MKRAERHHLKENELQRPAFQARGLIEERKDQATWITAAIAVVAVIGLGYFFWSARRQRQHLRSDGAGRARGSAGARRPVRSGDQRLPRHGAAQGRPAAD